MEESSRYMVNVYGFFLRCTAVIASNMFKIMANVYFFDEQGISIQTYYAC